LALLLPLLAGSGPALGQTDATAQGRLRFAPVIASEAAKQNIPPALADAVATVESAYDPSAIGGSGEVGLMQVLPSTAEMLGFRGTLAQLAEPETNIRFGVRYLAGAWAATGGRLCEALMKYRAGYGETTMSLRSITYCRRARDYLASIGSPLAEGPGAELPPVTPAMRAMTDGVASGGGDAGPRSDFLTPAERARMRAGRRTPEDERRYWAREEAHIRALKAQMAVRLAMKRR
jgi:hypothetical protein